jgi:hypothetical protein
MCSCVTEGEKIQILYYYIEISWVHIDIEHDETTPLMVEMIQYTRPRAYINKSLHLYKPSTALIEF